ncbi:rod shape-determining protein MreC [Erysipelothrix sp. HDW6B]|uniref:rod shape-determining protein MreC n=1 Tax=Erysipelothrix TaxID=1647 RepID=UPI0013580813|nr:MULTISPECIES: rod shape-determining protein MreC [Erysipelothrix]QIK86047.1 rod shape-determining protein MreC [Erysipelothrix sp. HDW6B]
MKRKSTFNSVMKTLILIIVVAIMGTGMIKGSKFYQNVDRNFFSFFSMMKYGLIDYPIETASGFMTDVATMWDVRYENDLLRHELENAAHWQTRVKALEEEISQLKAQNELKSVYTELVQINGTVKYHSSESWDSTITIDIGAADGVSVGDGVIAPQGVIGRVKHVSENQSEVSILTANDDNSKVSVRIETAPGEYVQGILDSYNHETNLFSINLLETNSSISPDMVVSTAGIGGVYPAGLLIGNVHSQRNIADGIGVVVYVKSNVDFDDLRFISVVKRP